MSSHELSEFMRQVSNYFSSEYERLRRRVHEDANLAGAQAEENWADLLRHWLPHTYHVVTRGRVLSPRGDASPEVDILVLSPSYPKYLLNKSYYLSAGVLAAFECKLTLRPDLLPKIVETCSAIKRIGLASDPERDRYDSCFPIFGILAHSQDRFYNADPSDKPRVVEWERRMRIGWALRDQLTRFVDDRRCVPDLICVADLGAMYRDHSDLALHFGRCVAEHDGIDGAADQTRDRVAYTWADTLIGTDRGAALAWFVSELIGKLSAFDKTLEGIHQYFREVVYSNGYGGQYVILKPKSNSHLPSDG